MLRGLFAATTIGALLIYMCFPAPAKADTLVSPSFQLREHSVGNSGMLDSISNQYRVNLSVGDTAVGQARSDDFRSGAGSVTTDDPTLTFVIHGFDVDFGSFSSGSTSVASSTFSVSNYTSYGYVVYITGEPPSNGEHQIEAMTETGFATPGLSQFGINLVANTLPSSIGANPDHGDFGAGTATANYSQSNQYRFVSGEAIAESDESSGETLYTISYIVNMEGLSPGGRYTSDLTLISVGTF